MSRRTKRSAAFLLAGCLTVAVPDLASAGPLTGPEWIVNTPSEALVDFGHGPILANDRHPPLPGPPVSLGPFPSPPIPPAGGGAAVSHWEVSSLSIREADAAAGDVVIALGSFRHLVGPHGEGAGPVFSFALTIAAGGTMFEILEDSKRSVFGHAAHFDGFRAGMSGTVNPAFNIQGYDLNIRGRHRLTRAEAEFPVPEPSTLALLGAGLLGLLGCGWRCRKPAS